MSPAQRNLYFFLCGEMGKAAKRFDRHALHAELGLPASSTAWGDADLDAFKKHVLAVTKAELPGDESAKRAMHTIGVLLSVLGEGEDYAETIVSRMNKGGKLGGKGRTLGSLTGEQLRGVVIALDRECNRRFPSRESLISEIGVQAASAQLDAAAMFGRVRAALRLDDMPPLAKMGIDRLRVVLATVRRMAGNAPALATEADDVPF